MRTPHWVSLERLKSMLPMWQPHWTWWRWFVPQTRPPNSKWWAYHHWLNVQKKWIEFFKGLSPLTTAQKLSTVRTDFHNIDWLGMAKQSEFTIILRRILQSAQSCLKRHNPDSNVTLTKGREGFIINLRRLSGWKSSYVQAMKKKHLPFVATRKQERQGPAMILSCQHSVSLFVSPFLHSTVKVYIMVHCILGCV